MNQPGYHPNPPRGCGTKVPGGFYAEGSVGPGGTLSSWTWMLGSHVDGEINCVVNIPPRLMKSGDPAASLLLGEFFGADIPFAAVVDQLDSPDVMRAEYAALAGRVGRVGLFDHVGETNYTPWQFARECAFYGPSRRVPPSLARQLVNQTPLPIIFAAKLPMMRTIDVRDEILNVIDRDIATTVPTWTHPKFSMSARDPERNSGADHFMTWVLSAMDGRIGRVDEDATRKDLIAAMSKKQPRQQTVFGASWITQLSYVLTGEEKPEDLEAVERAGFNLINLEDENV